LRINSVETSAFAGKLLYGRPIDTFDFAQCRLRSGLTKPEAFRENQFVIAVEP